MTDITNKFENLDSNIKIFSEIKNGECHFDVFYNDKTITKFFVIMSDASEEDAKKFILKRIKEYIL